MNTKSAIRDSEIAADPAIQTIVDRHAGEPGPLLPILHDIQARFGHIPDAAVPVVARAIQRSRAEIHGVLRFYPDFRSTPPKAVELRVCAAESCQACNGRSLEAHAQTLAERHGPEQLELRPVYCLGLCSQSPAAMINGRLHARLTPERLEALLDEALETAQ